MDEKRFREEIVPVTLKERKGETLVEADEGPRRDTTFEKLGKLKPAFKEDGSVTPGNSSSLNDGAAAVMVVSKDYAEAHGLEPLAKIQEHSSGRGGAEGYGHRACPCDKEGSEAGQASGWRRWGS